MIMDSIFWFVNEASTISYYKLVPVLPFLRLVLVPRYEDVLFDGVVELEAGHVGPDRCSAGALDRHDTGP